jgi:hypothetical protein
MLPGRCQPDVGIQGGEQPWLRGAGGPVVLAVTGPVVLTGFWWFTSWFLLAGPVPGRRRHGRVLAGHGGSVLNGRECVPRRADDWRSRSARMPKRHAGSGPFVTLRVGEHPDGTTERRESRRHCKHMFAAPRHAAPRGGRRKIAAAGSACCSWPARCLPGSARSFPPPHLAWVTRRSSQPCDASGGRPFGARDGGFGMIHVARQPAALAELPAVCVIAKLPSASAGPRS